MAIDLAGQEGAGGRAGARAASRRRACARARAPGSRSPTGGPPPSWRRGAARSSGAGVAFALGGHDERDFTATPTWWWSARACRSRCRDRGAARAPGVPVLGEVELACRLPRRRPWSAITGTNGKSTTTALTGAPLPARTGRTFVGGNLGHAALRAPLSGAPVDVVVVELSCFQLEGDRAVPPPGRRHPEPHARSPRPLPEHGRPTARPRRASSRTSSRATSPSSTTRDPRAMAAARSTRGERASPSASARRAPWRPRRRRRGGPLDRPRRRPGALPVRNRALRGRHNRENAMAAVASPG